MPRPKLHVVDGLTERKLAAGLFNETWRLMALPDRTPEQNDTLIHTAHASRYHWGRVGTTVNAARGEWLCSRVYAVLERPEPSLWHAHRCLDLLKEASSAEDWDMAAAYEALARACRLSGATAAANEWLERARVAAAAIANPEDRKPIEADIAGLAVPEG
jgi:hypothetical protein